MGDRAVGYASRVFVRSAVHTQCCCSTVWSLSSRQRSMLVWWSFAAALCHRCRIPRYGLSPIDSNALRARWLYRALIYHRVGLLSSSARRLPARTGTAVQVLGDRAAPVGMRRGWSSSYGFAAFFDDGPASNRRLSLASCPSPRGVGEGDAAVMRNGE